VPQDAVRRRCLGVSRHEAGHGSNRLRLATAAVLLLISGSSAGCTKQPLRPVAGITTDSTLAGVLVDFQPAWSHDSRFVAYHRAFWSSDGPRGGYVVSRWGGRPRFLIEGDYISPTDLRFSPDDRQLLAVSGFQLVLVDLETGKVSSPMHTERDVFHPSWSPDGRQIVYRRRFFYSWDAPESSGIHIFDLRTGIDSPVRHDGEVIRGDEPTWSPDGGHIAYITGTDLAHLMLMDTSGTNSQEIASVPTGYISHLHWYRRVATGMDGLLFTWQSGVPFNTVDGTYFVSRDGSTTLRWRDLGFNYDYSSDGSEVALPLPQARDSLGVLFTQATDDAIGTSLRQITEWSPMNPIFAGTGDGSISPRRVLKGGRP
jgi:WD40-like Beta Propeller Repeat